MAEDEEMPVDEAGNRAEVVMDPGATVSRMNLGRLYMQYVNAASRDLTTEIRTMLNIEGAVTKYKAPVRPQDVLNHPNFKKAEERILRYYDIVSPRMANWFRTGAYTKTMQEHLALVCEGSVSLYMPPENEVYSPHMLTLLEQEFPSTYGPVEYVGYSGKRVKTKRPVRIGKIYLILLEKTGDDYSATSSGRLQNFGVLSQLSNRDKYSQPTRTQPIRAWGETEIRIVASYAGPIIAAEFLDRNNSIESHAFALDKVLEAEKPSDIDKLVDRNVIQFGGARPLQLMKHYLLCGGVKFVFSPFDANAPSGLTEHTQSDEDEN